ncbi:MAG: hypothetical protein M1493_05730 [Firmicutes bacterium]|nr:hypothetical protein [Bacillota bacterium]
MQTFEVDRQYTGDFLHYENVLSHLERGDQGAVQVKDDCLTKHEEDVLSLGRVNGIGKRAIVPVIPISEDGGAVRKPKPNILI